MAIGAAERATRDFNRNNRELNKEVVAIISQFDDCVLAARATDQFFSEGWPLKAHQKQSEKDKEFRGAIQCLMRDKLQEAHWAINRFKRTVRDGGYYGASITSVTAIAWQKKEADMVWLKETGARYGIFLGRQNGVGKAL